MAYLGSTMIHDPSTVAAASQTGPEDFEDALIAPPALDNHVLDVPHPSTAPKTPPALLSPADLPADPKQAVWAIAANAKQQSSKRAQSSKQKPGQATQQPTISTFSTFNHIHIVQPYVHNGGNSNTNTHPNAAAAAAAASSNKEETANGCSTSTFSINASTPYTFANPFCTNALHTMLPGPGGKPKDSATNIAGQPPRPANAWILYRSDKMKNLAPEPGKPRRPQADISKLIAEMWKNEKPEIRQQYEALSDLKKAEHLAMYPGYRFQPMKKADKEKVRAERKAEKEKEKMAASLSMKSYRRPPKSKRGATEEGDDHDTAADDSTPTPSLGPTSPTSTAPGTAMFVWTQPQTVPETSVEPSTGPMSPTARQHTASYQPYARAPAGASTSAVAATAKRKRARTKVEVSAPAIPSGEPNQAHGFDYTGPVPNTSFSFYEAAQQPQESPGLIDFAAYSAQFMPGYHPAIPQPSSGANPDHNSHPTPPYNATIEHEMQSTAGFALEPIRGHNEIFEFTNLDLSLLDNQEIAVTLPDDLQFDLGLGLGLGTDALGLDGGGFAEFGSLAMDSGGSLGFGTNKVSADMVQFDAPPYNAHPNLSISTQILQQQPGHHSDPYNVTSPMETPQAATNFYGFPMHQPQEQQPALYHTAQHSFGQHDFASSSFGAYTSPNQPFLSPTYASPPPLSVIDESSTIGSPTSETFGSSQQTARTGRKATMNSWR